MTIITIFFSTKEIEALLMRSNQSNPVVEKDTEMYPNNQVTKLTILFQFLVSMKLKFATSKQFVAGKCIT